MTWIRFFKFILATIIITNLAIVIISNIYEPESRLVLIVSLVIFTMTTPIALYLMFNKFQVIALNSAFICFFLILMEALFFFRFIQHPGLITWRIASENISSVEFLDHLPYVKFKPNVYVLSQGYRGDDFTYEWFTDDFGFKNKNLDLTETNFDFIALGDSFTEGMGVTIDNTWTSIIQKKSNLKIYNAGVQGYSPSQMKATYEYLFEKIMHKGVIIGTLPTTYGRESIFIDDNNSHLVSKGSGGVNSIALAQGKKQGQSFLVQYLRLIFNSIKAYNKNKNVIDKLSRYEHEIPSEFPKAKNLISNKNWIAYTKNIIEIAEMAFQNGKEVILIQYPIRHEIYFNTNQLGINNISETDYYVELELLRIILPKEVILLDMLPYVKDKYNKKNQKMYFEIDGHMNEIGQEIVADFLIQKLS